MVKSAELYHIINTVIQENKDKGRIKDQSSPQFTQWIYRQFMKKHKLQPNSGSNSKCAKMKKIMKNFENVDTYVDLAELLRNVQQHIQRQILKKRNTKQKSVKYILNSMNNNQQIDQFQLQYPFCINDMQSNKNQLAIQQKNKLELSLEKTQKMLKKAEVVRKRGYQKGFYNSINKCQKFMNDLQDDSVQYGKMKLKNNKFSNFYKELGKEDSFRAQCQRKKLVLKTRKNIKIKTCGDDNLKGQRKIDNMLDLNHDQQYEEQDDEKTKQQKFWNLVQKKNKQEILSQLYQKQTLQQIEASKKKYKNSSKNAIQNSLQYATMMHKAASYLQIILEREHMNKWSVNKYKKNKTNSNVIRRKGIIKNLPGLPPSMKQLFLQKFKSQNIDKNVDKSFNNQSEGSDKNIQNEQRIDKVVSQQQIGQAQRFTLPVRKQNQKLLSRKTIQPRLSVPAFSVHSKGSAQISNKTNSQTKIQKKIQQQQQNLRQNQCKNQFFKTIKTQPSSDTIKNSQNSHFLSTNKKCENKLKNSKSIKQNFTFKNRKIKQMMLKKINQFNSSLEYVQKNLLNQSKESQLFLQEVKAKMDFDFTYLSKQNSIKIKQDKVLLEGLKYLSNPNQKITNFGKGIMRKTVHHYRG